jgi:hypothetical protein
MNCKFTETEGSLNAIKESDEQNHRPQFSNLFINLILFTFAPRQKNDIFSHATRHTHESDILDSRLKHSGMTCFNFYLVRPPAKATTKNITEKPP